MSLPIISCFRCLWIYCPLAAFMRSACYLSHLWPELGEAEMSALLQVSPKHVRTDVCNNLQIRSANSLWFKRRNWEPSMLPLQDQDWLHARRMWRKVNIQIKFSVILEDVFLIECSLGFYKSLTVLQKSDKDVSRGSLTCLCFFFQRRIRSWKFVIPHFSDYPYF